MSHDQGAPGAQSLAFVETLYAQYLDDPSGLPTEWVQYFDGMLASEGRTRIGPSFTPRSIFDPLPREFAVAAASNQAAFLQDRVDQLMRAYRVRAHRIAHVNPLGPPKVEIPELDPAFYGFSEADMSRTFSAETVPGPGVLELRQILDHLRTTYCRSIGAQFMHIDRLEVRNWLMRRMEMTQNRVTLTRDEEVSIFTSLTDAVLFEEFIQKKFLGAKSFSLEGAETLIPLLHLAIEKASTLGVEEVVIGMAHRGRLNVLANIMGKSPARIFLEFEDKTPDLYFGRGDVKYHLGYRSKRVTASGKPVGLRLCFNPSHLEFVDPVAVGLVRAVQDRIGDRKRQRAMGILIHGDAAFIGEGVVQETLNLSELEATRTGGTLHVIVNNQIGFTTPSEQGRSSTYASDVAKMLQIPIFHVNGEDPEAVAQVVRLALDFREEFESDVVIDMYCYRRRGHNETDEPSFTQPLMYKTIAQKKKVRDAYLEHLLSAGELDLETAEKITTERKTRLETFLEAARAGRIEPDTNRLDPDRKPWHGGPVENARVVRTGASREDLLRWMETLCRPPEGFKVHPKLERLLEGRREMARGDKPFDWGGAELLALGSLTQEGISIRLTGQDVGRGTFSHRHAILHDFETGEQFLSLQALAGDLARVEVHNSALSEAGVLGFEYGYSIGQPHTLTIWEAQFGDFVNTAQVIIDQFISSAEDKWDQLSNLVMLLPHGFEGQGPEHSSARLERFLQLCAEDNMQVVSPTTPAQCFHMLRRQALREWRKPLIVMSPKSLLRNPRAVSSLEELSEGEFHEVLPEIDEAVRAQTPSRILVCTGKVWFELMAERERLGIEDVPILRLEQLYPFPAKAMEEALSAYPKTVPVVFVQEEPENMGAWHWLRVQHLDRFFGHPFAGVTRDASASPATGSNNAHKQEQSSLLSRALARS